MEKTVYLEAPGADTHPLCQRGGPLTTMLIVDLRPRPTVDYAIQQARRAVAYRDATGKLPAIRPDFVGLNVGRREWNKDNTTKTMVGLTAQQGIRAYTTGLFPFSRDFAYPLAGTDGWYGNELDQFVAFADILVQAGMSDCPLHFDVSGEGIVDPWAVTAENVEMRDCVTGLCGKAGFPADASNPIDWVAPAHAKLDPALVLLAHSVGMSGPVIVPNSCDLPIPHRNFDRRAQAACKRIPGKVSHAWWTSEGDDFTAWAVDCRIAHVREGFPYWCHFSLQESSAEEIALRLRLASPSPTEGATVLFGTSLGDLSKLPSTIP